MLLDRTFFLAGAEWRAGAGRGGKVGTTPAPYTTTVIASAARVSAV